LFLHPRDYTVSGGDPDRWRTANFQLANGLPNFFLRQTLQFDEFAWQSRLVEKNQTTVCFALPANGPWNGVGAS
jgi:hypothetical protein